MAGPSESSAMRLAPTTKRYPPKANPPHRMSRFSTRTMQFGKMNKAMVPPPGAFTYTATSPRVLRAASKSVELPTLFQSSEEQGLSPQDLHFPQKVLTLRIPPPTVPPTLSSVNLPSQRDFVKPLQFTPLT